MWKKGQSGNLAGRPKKKISQILATLITDDEESATRIAASLVEFATTGKVQLGNKILEADNVDEWLNAVKWIFEHIDGKQPKQVESELTITVKRLDGNIPAHTLPPATDNR